MKIFQQKKEILMEWFRFDDRIHVENLDIFVWWFRKWIYCLIQSQFSFLMEVNICFERCCKQNALPDSEKWNFTYSNGHCIRYMLLVSCVWICLNCVVCLQAILSKFQIQWILSIFISWYEFKFCCFMLIKSKLKYLWKNLNIFYFNILFQLFFVLNNAKIRILT